MALGEAGATVYCTGRSTRGRRSEYDRPETIEETAEVVTRPAGTGIAVPVTTWTRSRCGRWSTGSTPSHGRLDVLVNDIWGAEKLIEWNAGVGARRSRRACGCCGWPWRPT